MATKSPKKYNIIKGYLTKLSYDNIVLEPSQYVELRLPIGEHAQVLGELKKYLNKKFSKYLKSVGSESVIIESLGIKGCWFIDLPYNETFYYCFETEDFINKQMNNGGCDVYATPFAS